MAGHNSPVIVIGGGAAGIMAAISAKRSGADVVICEHMKRLGRKILASGNGRCNLLNDRLDSSFYNSSAKSLVESVFKKFGKKEILEFFSGIGLKVYSEDGRIFPVTNQSSSVLKLLEMELKRLSIHVEYDFNVCGVSRTNDGYIVSSNSGGKINGRSLVFACGGKSYPALGSDGSAYKIVKNLGLTIVDPAPVAVPLVVKDQICHALQGQKISAHVKGLVRGEIECESDGDLLFTKYGLSGTSILDISRELSIAVNRKKITDVSVSVDLVPFMSHEALAAELSKRNRNKIAPEEMLTGILPNKFGEALKKDLMAASGQSIVHRLKDRKFHVSGTRGWNEADFTAGGVDVHEIDFNSLESRALKGIFFAGEVMDVDGRRGGYNLAWAWASGFIAGQAVASYA